VINLFINYLLFSNQLTARNMLENGTNNSVGDRLQL